MKAALSFPARKSLFVSFVCLYAVACPILLLYALGYIVQPSREELRRTGGIFVASIPAGASLLLDGRPYPRTSPMALLQLLPGPYRVRLTLDGYYPWEERVWVKPGRVTSLDNLLLVPSHRAYEEVAADWFLDLTPVPGAPYLLLEKGARARDVVVYDIRSRRFIPVIQGWSALRNASVTGFVTAPGSADFLMQIVDQAASGFLRVSIQQSRAVVRDITKVLPSPFEAPQWSAGNPDELFSYNGSSVDRTDLRSGEVTRDVVPQVSGFGLDGTWLYAITWQRHLLRFDLRRHTPQPLPQFDRGVDDFPLARIVHVRPAGAHLILLWGQGGRLTAVGPGFSSSMEAVRGYSLDTDRVLLWQARRLAILEKRPRAGEPALRWLNVAGSDIRQASFVAGNTNVLYRDGDSVFLASRLPEGEVKVSFVAAARLGTSTYYDQREGKLYYIDPETGRLFTTVIVPREQVIEQIVQQMRQESGH